MGFTLWQDAVDMEAGEQWRPQLEEAIRRSSVMVLVLTRAALSSRVVQDEWTYARSVGTYVIPIVEAAEVIDQASDWARKLDILNVDGRNPDYDATWKRFLGLLRNPPPRRPRPFTAPGLPLRLAQRPEELAKILGHIFDADRGSPIAVTTALQGGGGFGKTTLAIALCHDPRVRAAFDGGVLWVQFTQRTSQVDALALLNDQIRLLDPDGPSLSEPTLASARFRELLRGRDVLVVLDDLWSEWFLPLFLHNGPTFVITTRLRPIVAKARATLVFVDQLTPEQAVDLLSLSLQEVPEPDQMLPLRDLSVRLGGWALLLELVGAELGALTGGGRTLPEAIRFVDQRLDRRGVSYLDRRKESSRNSAIGDSMDASLTMLTSGQRERFHELGILRGDADLSFQTIGQLWAATAAYDDLDTEDALEAMQRLALFTRYDARSKVLRLHDVIRGVLVGRLTDSAGLNAKLVNHWGNAKRLPDEYAWRNLLFHLRGAERQDEVRRLLFDFDWIQAKLRAVGPVAVIADYQSEPTDPDCRLLASAMTMAGTSLTDPEQLPAQLVGRLGRLSGTSAALRDLLDKAGRHASAPALLPKRVFLPSIAQGVHRVMQIGAPVLSGVLSRDKVHLLIGLSNGTVQIWDWRRQDRVATLECGVGPIFQLDMIGERLAVGGYYDHGTYYPRPTAPVEVWNWTARERLYSIAEDASGIEEGFAISLNGGLVAMTTGEMNNLIHLYDWTTNALLQVIDPEAAGVMIGAQSNRPGRVSIVGNYLLYHENSSRRIDVWTAAERRYCGDISGQLNSEAAPFVVDGTLYVRARWTTRPSAAQAFSYRLDDEDNAPGLCVRHYDGNVSVATDSGPHLFVCSDVVKILDSTSEALVGLLEGHSDAIRSIDRLEDAIITSSEDGTIRVWDWPPAVETGPAVERNVEAGERIKRFYQPEITTIALQGSSAFVGTLGSLEEWSWSGAEVVNAVSLGEPIRALAVSDKWLVFSSFWSLKHGMLRTRLRAEWAGERQGGEWRRREVFSVSNGTFDFGDRGVVGAALLGDTCALVLQHHYTPANSLGWSNYTGNSICVLDLGREECELVLGEWISAVALSPHIVAGGTVEGHIDIWDRATGMLRRRLSNHSGPIAALQIEGNRLLSCSADRTAQVWDLTTLGSMLTLPHDSAVNALSARGGLLVTASADHILRLFDWESGEELARFTDDAPLVACEIAADSATILCGGKAGQLHILCANAPLSEVMSNPK
jgi:WD40 repeat protein